jgi:hypothetical protein
MISLMLAAALVAQPKPPTSQAAQERSVVAARKARRSKSSHAAAARATQAEEDDKRQRVAFEQAVAAQRAYEHNMGPIWAAQHANEIQAQRNALIAQANAIAKYRADHEIWLQMQSNSINAQAVMNQRR